MNRAGADTLSAIRRALVAILIFGSIGTLAELWLLEHTEGFWQRAPLVLLVAGTLVASWQVAAGSRSSTFMLRLTMVLFVVSGVVGIAQHYEGNVEFERELHPGAEGLELFRAAMSGATPALAPGTMTLLGLIGLVYTFRQPAAAPHNPEKGENGHDS
jgi:hypothetical protein